MISRTVLVSVAVHLFVGSLLAQDLPGTSYRSPLLGQAVQHPESLSGVWEAPDGQGGAVGLHLQLTTTVPAGTTTLRGVTQSWFGLEIGVYQRKGATVQLGEEIFLSDSYPDSDIRFQHGRLMVHSASPRAGVRAVDLDLVQQPGSAWEGRVHLGGFDARVKLLRPGVGERGPTNRLVGTWLEDTGSLPRARNCLHVAQQTATEWTGWVDSLWVPGNVQYPPHSSRPATAQERYGELGKVQRRPDRSFSFELGAYSGVCCSQTFVGTLNATGTLLKGAWPVGPDPLSRPSSWRKIRGDSCIDLRHYSRPPG